MITVEEYLERTLGLARSLPPVEVALEQALGLVLAGPVRARVAVPPFTNSAMDGFAVRGVDVSAPVALDVVGEVAAGSAASPIVAARQAVRIMTGGRLPPGADTVVPVELTDQPTGAAPLPSRILVTEAVPIGRHVRGAGDDVAADDLVLETGTMLGPAALAAAGSVGYGSVSAHPAPRVAVIATGAELVAAGVVLGPGQIPDSNSVMLATLVLRAGGRVARVSRVPDDPERLGVELAAAAAESDLIFTSGGISVGAYDVVRQVPGVELEFVQVAMQPGKPQALGRVAAADGSLVPLLGFPGNPVSAFVSFQVFGRPVLARLAGQEDGEPEVRWCRAAAGWESPHGKRQFVPVRRIGEECLPAHRLGSGSHLIASLHRADALAVVPEGVTKVAVGDLLQVMEV